MSAEGKVAMVTGGARRIGKAISVTLHEAGYRVVIHCNGSIQEANRLKEEMNRTRQNSVEIVQADLSVNVADTAKRIVEEAARKWGRLDLVVNNASNFIASTLHDTTSEKWDSSMEVNLKAPVFIMQAAAPFLKKQSGSIVNISDLLGVKPMETHFAHSVSKAGLISATKNAALSLGPEVRVNSIAPGYIIWPEVDLDKFTEELRQDWIRRTPLKRSGCPEDVAQTILFLSSPAANFITGQIIELDGGRGLTFSD